MRIASVAAVLLIASAVWAQTDEQPATAPAGESTATRAPFTIQQATFPETVIFTLMRKLPLVEGTTAADTRKEIETWRAFAHDRKRKVDDAWLAPQEFKRRRDLFTSHLKDAQELRPKGAPRRRDGQGCRGPSQREERQHAKVMQAAVVWGDPLLRDFLTGVAELLTKGSARARRAGLRRVREGGPRGCGVPPGPRHGPAEPEPPAGRA